MSSVPPDELVDDVRSIESSMTSKSTSGGTTGRGDALRSITGIRPSLHPTVINCISEALLLRSRSILSRISRSSSSTSTNDENGNDDKDIDIDVGNPSSTPLRVAITAGDIALSSIERRRDASRADGDIDSAFTTEESNAVSGRVVGVVMRMRALEYELAGRVNAVDWVKKYDEYYGFGILTEECTSISTSTTEEEGRGEEEGTSDDDGGGEGGGGSSLLSIEGTVAEKIRTDPLFRMNRAECLLALFLSTVEGPRMETLGIDVPGGSDVDFVDDDRLRVLLPDFISNP
jgi:hypothetical protein